MRHAWKDMPEMGCLPSIIFPVLTAICFPVAIIFLLIYCFIKDHEEAAQSAYNIIMMIAMGFVIIASPIVTFISFFVLGFETTIKEQGFLVFVSLIEIIVSIVIVVKSYNRRKMLNNETPEERETRIKLEREKEKQRLENIKSRRLNKPFSNKDTHICNIFLYDRVSSEERARIKQEIIRHVSKGTNLSKETWEIYYYRIVQNNPDFPPKRNY